MTPVAVVSTIIELVVIVGLPGAWMLNRVRAIQTQRLMLHDDVLYISHGFLGSLKRIPAGDISTVVYTSGINVGRTTPSFWSRGGLLVLDLRGRVISHATKIPQTSLPWYRVYEAIPAADHRELPGCTRTQFMKEYPGSLRFGQLWGPVRWTLTILVLVVPVVLVLAGVVVAHYPG